MVRFFVVLSTLIIASVPFGVSSATLTVRARSEISAATVTPDPADSALPAVKARYAGVVEGVIASIDYRSGTISVQTSNRRLDVIVLPSTTIQSSTNAFHTIADIVKGQRVQVFMSQRGNSFVAEIIHLR